jgi:maltose/maltodextrin transport system substrate-binding protein
MKIFLVTLFSFISVALFGQKQADNKGFCRQSRDESLIPIRPGLPGKQPFWNEKAKMFKYAPSFNNKKLKEIIPVKYRYSAFSFTDKKYYSFTDSTGTQSLAPIWNQLPTGNIYLKIEGISKEGYVYLAQDRMFYKAATFCPPYPKAKYSYKDALLKGLNFLYHQNYIKSWYSTGEPDHKEMPLYCYSAKVIASVIDGMLLYNKYFPRNDTSIIIARKAADYLIAKAEPEGSPLEYFSQTYEGTQLAANIYGNEILMSEPSWTGITFLNLYDKTKDKKYFKAAINIANTYIKNQLPSGTWYIRVNKITGKPTSQVLCIPNTIINFLSVLVNKYKQIQYQPNIQAAIKWIMDNPVKTFDWTGQFEDVAANSPYQNLSHYEASWFAMRLLNNKSKDSSYIRLAKELIAFCEDQFIVWQKPDIYDDRNGLSNEWHAPAALEQYHCYLPIDASTDQMIFMFCKAYETTGSPIYRAKAIALANSIVNCQKENGKIPTFLYPFRKDKFWPNCMVYSLRMLEKISSLK